MIDFKKHMDDEREMRAGRRCYRVPPRPSPVAPDGWCVVGSEHGVCDASTAKPVSEWMLLEKHADRYARLLTNVQADYLLSVCRVPVTRLEGGAS